MKRLPIGLAIGLAAAFWVGLGLYFVGSNAENPAKTVRIVSVQDDTATEKKEAPTAKNQQSNTQPTKKTEPTRHWDSYVPPPKPTCNEARKKQLEQQRDAEMNNEEAIHNDNVATIKQKYYARGIGDSSYSGTELDSEQYRYETALTRIWDAYTSAVYWISCSP